VEDQSLEVGMMMKRKGIVFALLATLTLLGCGPTRNSEPLVTEMKITDASVQRGKVIFDAYCYSCHLQGQGGMAPALNNKPLPRFLIRFQVRHGLGTMPGFSEEKISDRQLEDLANYVAALREHTH
jgi:mono/diheme cytochrome c family protein